MADSLNPPETALMMDSLLAWTVLDGFPDAILITDTVGVVQYVNHAAVRLLGVAHARARGRPVHEILRLHDGATDQPIVAPLSFLLSASCADTLAPCGYAQLVRRDGTKLPIDCSIGTIHASRHRPAALVLTLRDAKRTHARIEQLVKAKCRDEHSPQVPGGAPPSGGIA
jgi:PAS domain S-box-containing protein